MDSEARPSVASEYVTPSMKDERLLMWRCNCSRVNVRGPHQDDGVYVCGGCRMEVSGVRVFAFDEVGEVGA